MFYVPYRLGGPHPVASLLGGSPTLGSRLLRRLDALLSVCLEHRTSGVEDSKETREQHADTVDHTTTPELLENYFLSRNFNRLNSHI